MRILIMILAMVFSGLAIAEKPEWVGQKAKPTEEQKAAHKAAMNAKEDADDMDGEAKKPRGKPEKVKGNKAEKDMADRKDTDKGSEEGQAKREEKSSGWWKFWED